MNSYMKLMFLYQKLQIDSTDLIVKHSLIPKTGAENFTIRRSLVDGITSKPPEIN